jgi:hypothetical protein
MAFWKSKNFITPQYTKLGIGFARMSGEGMITIWLWADDEPIFSIGLNAEAITQYFRLPPHPGALKFMVTVNTGGGACVLEDLAFAQTPSELRDV